MGEEIIYLEKSINHILLFFRKFIVKNAYKFIYFNCYFVTVICKNYKNMFEFLFNFHYKLLKKWGKK